MATDYEHMISRRSFIAMAAVLPAAAALCSPAMAFADDTLVAGSGTGFSDEDGSTVLIAAASGSGTCEMYRLYNPNSGEHFYTSSMAERNNLVKVGWKYEGVGWTAPVMSKTPVYRLYSGTDHHYTTSVEERNGLIKVGWKDEGTGWYSDDAKAVPLYRQFNPNVNPRAARNNSGSHNYTTSKTENDSLVKAGWKAEGVGWYGCAAGEADATTRELRKLNGWWQSGGEIGSRWDHMVDGIVYQYRYYPDFATAESAGLGSEGLIRIETIASVSRFNAGASKVAKGAGYQIRIEYSANKYQSYLHFDDQPDGLVCSELDGKHYSGGGSYSRVSDASVPQGLLSLARQNE